MKSIDVVPAWYWPDGVPRYQTLPRTTAYKTAVERWARRRPTAVALAENGTEVDYRSLDERVRCASTRIRRSIGASSGERVRPRVALAADGIDAAIVILGALHAGADALLLDPAMPDAKLHALLASFRCELFVAEDRGAAGQCATADPRRIAHPAADGVSEAEASKDGSQAGRLGLCWGDGFALQLDAALLGWSQAFRAFTMLDKDELFTVARPLATWEGLIGLLAPLSVGATAILHAGTLEATLQAADRTRVAGIWLDWAQAEALTSAASVRPRHGGTKWAYVSVDTPFSARKRRRLGRLLDAQALSIFGTPGTGPVAASPRTWFIDEAVGTPMTGVDLYPVDHAAARLAAPPWPLLSSASLGVKSTFFTPEMTVEGAAPGRFVEDGVLDTGVASVIDANGFLYLV